MATNRQTKSTASRKQGAPARKGPAATEKKAAKKEPAKKAVTRKAAASKTRKVAATSKTTTARPKSKAKTVQSKSRKPQSKQVFAVSHHRDADFEEGLREYAKYRDFGFSKATGGLVQAHVIRFVPPCKPEEVAKRHYHDIDFQMVYVLKGWLKSEFEGQGEVVMKAGSSWIQPPRIKHTLLEYSDDCEVLEIILPADFPTVLL